MNLLERYMTEVGFTPPTNLKDLEEYNTNTDLFHYVDGEEGDNGTIFYISSSTNKVLARRDIRGGDDEDIYFTVDFAKRAVDEIVRIIKHRMVTNVGICSEVLP